jgi:hypothetical protein
MLPSPPARSTLTIERQPLTPARRKQRTTYREVKQPIFEEDPNNLDKILSKQEEPVISDIKQDTIDWCADLSILSLIPESVYDMEIKTDAPETHKNLAYFVRGCGRVYKKTFKAKCKLPSDSALDVLRFMSTNKILEVEITHVLTTDLSRACHVDTVESCRILVVSATRVRIAVNGVLYVYFNVRYRLPQAGKWSIQQLPLRLHYVPHSDSWAWLLFVPSSLVPSSVDLMSGMKNAVFDLQHVHWTNLYQPEKTYIQVVEELTSPGFAVQAKVDENGIDMLTSELQRRHEKKLMEFNSLVEKCFFVDDQQKDNKNNILWLPLNDKSIPTHISAFVSEPKSAACFSTKKLLESDIWILLMLGDEETKSKQPNKKSKNPHLQPWIDVYTDVTCVVFKGVVAGRPTRAPQALSINVLPLLIFVLFDVYRDSKIGLCLSQYNTIFTSFLLVQKETAAHVKLNRQLHAAMSSVFEALPHPPFASEVTIPV